MKYIILFGKGIRLGLDVGESIGPFDSILEACNWLSLNPECDSPNVTIISLFPVNA